MATSMALRGVSNKFQLLAILAAIVVGVISLAPGMQTWVSQRQAIAEAQADVDQAKADVLTMQEERKRWEDPVYIRSQARDRLYYVMPGEISYLVLGADEIDPNDTSGTVGAQLADRTNTSEISTEIRETKNNWVDAVLESVIRAGTEVPTEESTGATK
ncbi:MAG: hypothetical protein RLZZ258_836 [Actinomycetota bacterium]|jgi:cell division protein FtsB